MHTCVHACKSVLVYICACECNLQSIGVVGGGGGGSAFLQKAELCKIGNDCAYPDSIIVVMTYMI